MFVASMVFAVFRGFRVLAACAVLAVFACPPLMFPFFLNPEYEEIKKKSKYSKYREVPVSLSLQ
jgi:hypothetical protein